MESLITLAFEENKVIIDTEGFEGKNDGQFKPFLPIPGGLNINELAGYAQTIMTCERNVNKYMGTKQDLKVKTQKNWRKKSETLLTVLLPIKN